MKQSLFRLVILLRHRVMKKTLSRSINKPRSSSCTNNGAIHKRRMLQIDELDEWRTSGNEEQKQHYVEFKNELNHFKVKGQVLLDKMDPQVFTLKSNVDRVTPFMVLNVFPYDTVEVTHTEFETFNVNGHQLKLYNGEDFKNDREGLQLLEPPNHAYKISHDEHSRQIQSHRSRFKKAKRPSVPEFDVALELYTEEFMSTEDFLQLHQHIHYSPSRCWIELTGGLTNYDVSRSKSMTIGHVFDLAYFIALACRNQTERHKNGPIFLGPYVTRLG
ncbi:hypothetical protein GOBAR_AA14578 [Gossypium barbadense]|uniref:Uncharacterized protein n=1 Tax=Gossypium barbadense TaxID=3634 RepID=A0A2P5XRU4_GOSBA|nr:hypothetical protein GOBAR_AA14578 [Gossypium barbadense]